VSGPPRRARGPAGLLAAVYTVFAIAAGARSLYQIATKFDEAPVAYLLSAAAALIYLFAARCFARPSAASWRAAVAALGVELAGVLLVGALSLWRDDLFPDATVWSDFGAGYGFIPLVLPVAGLAWLLRPATRAQFATVG
jgi:hypothetical protein